VRARVHVRVHPKGDGRDRAHALRDTLEVGQFLRALDVDLVDARGQRGFQFNGRLAHAGEHDALGRHPRR
jgi:hypothetical protein